MEDSTWVKLGLGILLAGGLASCGGDKDGHATGAAPTGGRTGFTVDGGVYASTGGSTDNTIGGTGTATGGRGTAESGGNAGAGSRIASGGTAGATVTGSAGSFGAAANTIATCKDGVRNGKETGVDCGGGSCPSCAPGIECVLSSDCNSLVCAAGVCSAASCEDSVKNGGETDIDCGGSCPICPTGKTCKVATDCDSRVCSRTCLAATCTDKVKNGTETDVDCGGACAPCDAGRACALAKDCTSQICMSASCANASCVDGVLNGPEQDVDCGGTCPACATGLHCSSNTDCAELYCAASICTHPTCTDKLQNGTETDVDCGGKCATCPAARQCKVSSDCSNGYCYFGRCPAANVEVQAGRVFEVGIGPLTLFNGVQLQPDSAAELVVGLAGEHGYSLLSGGSPKGFTKLQRFPDVLAQPKLVRDIDGDGQIEVMFLTQYEEYGNFYPLGWRLDRFVNGTLTTLDSASDVLQGFDFADVNQDGAVDLLYLWGAYSEFRSKLMARLGDGSGKFGASQTILTTSAENGFPPYSYINQIKVVDADEDAYPDLLIVNGEVSPYTVYRVHGNGSGGFKSPAEALLDVDPNLWAAEDFDGNGIDDVVSGISTKTLRYGNVDGTLSAPLKIPAEADDPVTVYDVDGDGTPEIITGDNDLTFWKVGTSSVESVAKLNVATTFLIGPYFGDFDGNGLVDVAVAQNGRENDDKGVGANVAVYYQQSPFAFVAHQAIKAKHQFVSLVAVDDIDGNGSNDVLSVYDRHFSDEPPTVGPGISLFDGKTLLKHMDLDLSATDPIGNGGGIGKFNGVSGTTGDFNGDGLLDIAMDGFDGSFVMLQSLAGSFVVTQQLANTRSTLAINLNDDRYSELILANTWTMDIYAADGNGSLVLDYSLDLGSDARIARLSRSDFDGDGRLDVIVTGYTSVMSQTSGTLSYRDWNNVSRTWLMRNDGSGHLAVPVPIDHHPFTYTGNWNDCGGAQDATVGDFDGDGVVDLGVAYVEFGQYTLYFSKGPGGPAKFLDCDVLLHPTGTVAYDWNGDGRDDVAVSNFSSSALSFMQSVGRERCPELHGHYRLGHKPLNVALLKQGSLELPAVVASGYLGLQIVPFRRKPL